MESPLKLNYFRDGLLKGLLLNRTAGSIHQRTALLKKPAVIRWTVEKVLGDFSHIVTIYE